MNRVARSLGNSSLVAPWLQRIENLRGRYHMDKAMSVEKFKHELLRDDPRYANPRHLAHYEHQVFSQNGEDGMLEQIFERIGVEAKFAVEFGCGDGIQNNSLYLLHRGFDALWIDGSDKLIDTIRSTHGQFIDAGQLTVANHFLTAENIEQLFAQYDVPTEPDLISIDIDSNDYWVWDAITNYRPRVFVLEYNAFWPPSTSWTQTYQPDRGWDGTTYWGASLKALENLGEKKDYALVGCDLAGVNAFFVRNDLIGDNFDGPFNAEQCYEPARYFLSNTLLRRRGIGPFVSP